MNNEAKSLPQKEMMPKFPCTHQIFHVQEEKLFLESINQNGSQINKDIPFYISLTLTWTVLCTIAKWNLLHVFLF